MTLASCVWVSREIPVGAWKHCSMTFLSTFMPFPPFLLLQPKPECLQTSVFQAFFMWSFHLLVPLTNSTAQSGMQGAERISTSDCLVAAFMLVARRKGRRKSENDVLKHEARREISMTSSTSTMHRAITSSSGPLAWSCSDPKTNVFSCTRHSMREQSLRTSRPPAKLLDRNAICSSAMSDRIASMAAARVVLCVLKWARS
mmetsp:Transcript_2520/g.6005  ORF Transcript_2520/g.6005 Transcript_2520/m.6005 type:complete len:201 (-) Transcript_2520:3592-4194(-)